MPEADYFLSTLQCGILVRIHVYHWLGELLRTEICYIILCFCRERRTYPARYFSDCTESHDRPALPDTVMMLNWRNAATLRGKTLKASHMIDPLSLSNMNATGLYDLGRSAAAPRSR